VTVKLAEALFPAASAALQLTVVVPVGNVPPDAGVHATAIGPSTRSVAVGSVYVTAAPALEVAAAVIGAGTLLIVGAIVSVHDVAPAAEVVPAGHAIASVAPVVVT
jgi:hypothetical protein